LFDSYNPHELLSRPQPRLDLFARPINQVPLEDFFAAVSHITITPYSFNITHTHTHTTSKPSLVVSLSSSKRVMVNNQEQAASKRAKLRRRNVEIPNQVAAGIGVLGIVIVGAFVFDSLFNSAGLQPKIKEA